jgi:hypothetical protein
MRCGDHVLIFDAGSGAASLGAQLESEGVTDFDLYLSHCPFRPHHRAAVPETAVRPQCNGARSRRAFRGRDDVSGNGGALHGPALLPGDSQALSRQASNTATSARLTFFHPIRTSPSPRCAFRHPNGAVGYRVDFAGRSACYVTDTEHSPGQLDDALVAAIRDADILIYDCMYTDAEFTWLPRLRALNLGRRRAPLRGRERTAVGDFPPSTGPR